MKKTFLLTVLLALLPFLLLLQSCELFLEEEPLGSIHAIYVGLNYHGTDVNHLEGTLNDAEELEQCLSTLSTRHHRTYHSYSLLQKGGSSPSDYDPSSTFDSLPTKGHVLQAIENLQPFLTENDLTIFSYSGHGHNDGSLVLASPDASDPTIFDKDKKLKKDALLSVTELLEALSKLPGKQLLIMDSCYCGSFVEDSGSSVSLIEKEQFLDEAFSTYFSSERYSPTLFVMAATTASNTSKEPVSSSHIHGHFTKAVLDGLGWDCRTHSLQASTPAMKKGVLTTDSLYAYVLENQDFPLAGTNPKRYQHPTISGGAYTLRLF